MTSGRDAAGTVASLPARAPATRPGRAPRRRARWPVVAAVAALALVAAGYMVGFTGVLGVRTVTVTGVRALTAEQVRATAAVPHGQPLARVDVDGIAERVRGLAGVERVAVARSWPGTVRIIVTERRGVAVVSRDGRLWLVDAGGVVFQRLSRRPRLPLLAVPEVGPGNPAARAALTAVAALPAPVTAQLTRVRAPTAEQVTLVLTGGRTVLWGGAEDSTAKGAVLRALLTRPGTHYDVSTPSVVTVR